MLNIIAFADDLVISAPNADTIQNIVDVLCQDLDELNLKINLKRTSVMLLNQNKNSFPVSKICVNEIQISYAKNVGIYNLQCIFYLHLLMEIYRNLQNLKKTCDSLKF